MGEPRGFFSQDQAARLAGLTARQLGYWDRTDVYSPSHTVEGRGRPYARLHSFRDIVALRTLAQLRRRVSLQALRQIGSWLRARFTEPWSRLRFYVAGGRVYFDDPASGLRVGTRPAGQSALRFEFDMERIAADVAGEVRRLRERQPSDVGRVERYRNVVQSAPVIAGTRIPTAMIWSFHEAGYDTAAIQREYPHLTEVDIRAAIDHEGARRRMRAG
jgi:uncharacterized protein (DUF433 family)